MIKVSANLSKKVPLRNVEFSSQQFGASLEIEVSDGEKPEILKAKIHELYSLLAQSVDEQIAAASGAAPKPSGNGQAPASRPRWNGNGNGNGHGNGNGNGNGQPQRRAAMATQAQQRAIVRICEAQGLEVQAILADFNAASPAQLTLRQASSVIDQLKARRA